MTYEVTKFISLQTHTHTQSVDAAVLGYNVIFLNPLKFTEVVIAQYVV